MKIKHLIIPSLALIGLTACSNEEPVALENGKTVEVTFAANLPGTRAYGDGYTATNLYWAVYDKNGKKVLTDYGTGLTLDHFPAGNLHTTVTMQLVTGETYEIVFWAQSSASPYTFNAGATKADGVTISANYTDVENNNENLDAFYCKKTLTVKADELNQEAELIRPFAQLNIATDDLAVVQATDGLAPTQSSVTVSGVYTGFDLMGGTCTGTATEVTYKMANLPTGTIEVADKNYDYLSMSYFFAPVDGYVQDNVTMTVNNFADGVRSYGNIPLRANYRTNIVGSLLTSNVLYDVYINPIFTLPDYDIFPWTGGVETPTPNADGEYIISTPDQLAGIAQMVANGETFSGKVIKLNKDIDLNNMAWTPIGGKGKPFMGSFDGQGHTIKNLKVDSPEYSGLFGLFKEDSNISAGSPGGAVTREPNYIKNVNIDGADVKGAHFAGALAGHLTLWYNSVTGCEVNNVVVTGYEWEDEDANKIGGFAGYIQIESAQVDNNKITNAKVYAIRDCGAFAGALGNGAGWDGPNPDSVSGNVVDNAKLYMIGTVDASKRNFGEFIGRNMFPALDLSSNTVTNVTIIP